MQQPCQETTPCLVLPLVLPALPVAATSAVTSVQGPGHLVHVSQERFGGASPLTFQKEAPSSLREMALTSGAGTTWTEGSVAPHPSL